MLNRTINSRLLARSAIAAAVLAGWLAADAALSQEAQKASRPAAAAKETDESSVLEVYRLEHSDAAVALAVLQEVFADHEEFRLSADEKTNSLVTYCSRRDHAEVAGIIERIDVPPQENSQIKMLSVVESFAGDLAKVLEALTDGEETRISVDERTNSVIVVGTPEKLMLLEAIALKLDEASQERAKPRFAPTTTFYVRFVWLASGPDGSDGDDPAEDLDDVLAELAKLGIDDVRQVAQAIVNVGMDGQFTASCQPVYGERPAQWKIDGDLEEADEALKLRIQLSATHGAHVVKSDSGITQVAETQLVDLETDLVIPEGHYIVLGITPTGKTQSIFVVQITPRK